MELFKIIKKTFDLVRNEVARVSSDSKSFATKLVNNEVSRIEAETDAAINSLDISLSSNLRTKVSSVLYIKTTDISNEGELGEIDAEFLEWNILRRVFTKGVVGKTESGLNFETGSGELKSIGKHEFINLDTSWGKSKAGDNGGIGSVKYLCNVELPGDGVNLERAFYSIGARYISCKDMKDSYSGSCASMFESCNLLKYIDFQIPSKASNYNRVFYNCVSLVHTNFDINWPNASDAGYAFYYNEGMKNDMSSKLNVTLRYTNSVSYMFYNCSKLSFVGNIYTIENGTRFLDYMFRGCTNLESVDRIETGALSFRHMFEWCEKLRVIKEMETITGANIDIRQMFYQCKALVSAPEIQSPINTMSEAFYGCTSLKSIPLYKVTSNLSLGLNLSNHPNLTDLGGFDGLKAGVNISNSPLLTRQSCLNLFNYAGTVETTSNRAFSINSTAYSRLSEEDIAIAVNKGWKVYSA